MAATHQTAGLLFAPLLDEDPARIGDFWLDARTVIRPSGIAYLAHSDAPHSDRTPSGRAQSGRANSDPAHSDASTPVLLVVLSQGASHDAAARDRFAGEVNKLHIDTVVARGGRDQDTGRLADRYRSEDDDPTQPDQEPLAPWVALAYDGSPAALAECDRLLAMVALAGTRPLGRVAGPDYRLSWIDDQRRGTSRVWPLPWPGRHERAGWLSLLVSWLLVVLLAAIALLVAVLLFMNAPPEPPQPPVPTSATASSSSSSSSNSSSSSSPQSGSPSSASPSKQSGSPSSSPSKGSASPSKGGSSPSSSSASATPSNSSSSSSSSPTPSDSGSPTGEGSDHPSMQSQAPSGSASGGGQSTPPNKRL